MLEDLVLQQQLLEAMKMSEYYSEKGFVFTAVKKDEFRNLREVLDFLGIGYYIDPHKDRYELCVLFQQAIRLLRELAEIKSQSFDELTAGKFQFFKHKGYGLIMPDSKKIEVPKTFISTEGTVVEVPKKQKSFSDIPTLMLDWKKLK